jgi:ABC-type transport system involved in multi-copper enzyme maturation permease subunit
MRPVDGRGPAPRSSIHHQWGSTIPRSTGVNRSLHQIGIMAGFTLREAARKRILAGAVVLTFLFVGLYAVGARYGYRSIDNSRNLTDLTRPLFKVFIMLAGLQVTTFVGSLLAIFISVGTISSEVDNRLLDAILPRPITRWEIVVGKWIGFALMLSVYVTVTTLAVVFVTRLLGGYWPRNVALGVLVLILSSLFLMTLALVGSSYFSTVTNGVIVTVLYAVGVIAGQMEQVGASLPTPNDSLERIGVIVSLIIPSDSLWRLASAQMSPERLATFGIPSPWTSVNPPTYWIAVWAAGLIIGGICLAGWAFSHRDL